MSFNRIKEVSHLDRMQNLEKLYLASNRIKEIPSFAANLSSIRILELGCNSISVMVIVGKVIENFRYGKAFETGRIVLGIKPYFPH